MNELSSTLGLIRRSQRLSFGSQVLQDIRAQKSTLVLIATDASNRTKKQLTDKCNSYHVAYRICTDSDTLSNAIGKTNIKCISINDPGWKRVLMDTIDRNEVD